MRIFALLIAGLLLGNAGFSKPHKPRIAAGPYAMHTASDEAIIWLLVEGANDARLVLAAETDTVYSHSLSSYPRWKAYTPFMFRIGGLQEQTAYTCQVMCGRDTLECDWSFETPAAHPEEITFLIGSCAFRPQGPAAILKEGPLKIYDVMATENADFMIWLGDNFYYLYKEFESEGLMHRKQIWTRLAPEINQFMKSLPQYEIWDDHDYGPNDSYGSWEGKKRSLDVCKTYWGNPSFGTDALEGNFCTFKKGNSEFFLLDDRYFRTPPTTEPAGIMGQMQMQWLMQGLKASTADFKFICFGTQAFNTESPSESWFRYPDEQRAFFEFIRKEKIEGIVFLTGDRHWTEVLKLNLADAYPIYDITCSPLTSWARVLKKDDPEEKNPLRIEESFYRSWNYGKVTVSGSGENATCALEIRDNGGALIWSLEIKRSELQFKKKAGASAQ